jgi:5-methylcytosine-specific restriction endonuclease McrA
MARGRRGRYSYFYVSYLKSPAWQDKRRQALRRAGYRCQACGKRNHLQVHHLTYIRLGHELPTDLVCLCSACHAVADVVRRLSR